MNNEDFEEGMSCVAEDQYNHGFEEGKKHRNTEILAKMKEMEKNQITGICWNELQTYLEIQIKGDELK